MSIKYLIWVGSFLRRKKKNWNHKKVGCGLYRNVFLRTLKNLVITHLNWITEDIFPFEFFLFLNYLIPWFSSCTPSTVKCMLFIHLSSAYYYTSSDCMCILHFILHCLHIIICFVILHVHILLHFTYRIN